MMTLPDDIVKRQFPRNGSLKFTDLLQVVHALFPDHSVTKDDDGQLIISTGLALTSTEDVVLFQATKSIQ